MAESDDLRAFIRELMARFDRKTDAFERAQRAYERQLGLMREENRVYFESLKADTVEMQAEGRAGREALYQILDKLDGGGATPA